jgi:hypothetical protein
MHACNLYSSIFIFCFNIHSYTFIFTYIYVCTFICCIYSYINLYTRDAGRRIGAQFYSFYMVYSMNSFGEGPCPHKPAMTYIHIHTHIYIHIHLYSSIDFYIYIYMYIFTYIFRGFYTLIYIYIDSYTFFYKSEPDPHSHAHRRPQDWSTIP